MSQDTRPTATDASYETMQNNFSVTESRNNPEQAFLISSCHPASGSTSSISHTRIGILLSSGFHVPPGAQRQRRRHKQREGMQIKSVNLFAGKSLISLSTHRGGGCEGYVDGSRENGIVGNDRIFPLGRR